MTAAGSTIASPVAITGATRPSHRLRHDRPMTTPELVAEIEWLTSQGCSAWEVVAAFGTTANALEKRLSRAHRLDLARQFMDVRRVESGGLH